MTDEAFRVMALATLGALGALGATSGTVCIFFLRRYRIQLDRAREELYIMLRQHQTEYRDGISRVARAVDFLEKSAHSTEDALRGRLTHSLRAQAIQFLRAGMSPDAAAAAAGVARRDMHLIAKVSRILASSQ
jgi:hypothetical protein